MHVSLHVANRNLPNATSNTQCPSVKSSYYNVLLILFSAGADARALASKSSRRLTVIPCDVTSDEQVITARNLVSETVAEENLGMIHD